MTTPPTIRALYVHVPFCRTRCGYCDFYSDVLMPAAVDPLIGALLAELEGACAHWRPRFRTVFVGGGTPTVLPVEQLARLLEGCAAHTDADAEFTVEANPATVTPAVAAALARAGANRVSLGAQSFIPEELAALERTHDPADVRRTVDICRDHGLPAISLDLIFGIPGQTADSWRASLEAAVALRPDHLSCYGLTYETGTRLSAQRDAGLVTPVDEDLEADLYELTIDTLAAAGFEHYEISNFARPGCACRHNLVYWRNEPYLGVGPAAAGYVPAACTSPGWSAAEKPNQGAGGALVRYRNVPDTAAYVDAIRAGRSPWVEQECLDDEARARETTLLALRLTAGIDRAAFRTRFGDDPAERFAEIVARHRAAGLLDVTPEAIRLTRRGLLLANRVMGEFV